MLPLKRWFVPITISRVKVVTRVSSISGQPMAYCGVMKVYIFGILVAYLQITNPWDA